ncbi:hypothetical protein VBZ51_12015 [Maribacter sp. HS]|uniref:hypothetical protein n=1 Tax=Maribacter sp. HS TaxID=3110480 RepID=UPI003A8A7FB6
MIKQFTENVPYGLSQQMTIEYNNRLSDVNFFISGKYDYYASLRENSETVKLLLALSIFYKRVLTNFESANKFSSRIVFNSDADSIQLGTYDLSSKELFKMRKTVISFKTLMDKYSVPLTLFEYLETKEFLRKVKIFQNSFLNEDNG